MIIIVPYFQTLNENCFAIQNKEPKKGYLITKAKWIPVLNAVKIVAGFEKWMLDYRVKIRD
jgi:hypothetical protein